MHTKVLIIGSGPAGYSAAIYAARANLRPILVAGLQKGGQLTITTDVENYPGFVETIQGPWLMEQMEKQAEKVGTTIYADIIASVDFSNRPFTCVGNSGNNTYCADTVIIATGARARWLNLDSEQAFMGKGVSACATCDGFFYTGKKVAVVGGGSSAVEEALYLASLGCQVTLVHRRDTLRAEAILVARLHKNAGISIQWNTIVQEIVGDAQGVTGVSVKDTKSGREQTLPVSAVFIAIGHIPATEIFQETGLHMDQQGYIDTIAGTPKTNIAGVFAAGDVSDKVYRQAITAAGAGCAAALEAQKFLENA